MDPLITGVEWPTLTSGAYEIRSHVLCNDVGYVA